MSSNSPTPAPATSSKLSWLPSVLSALAAIATVAEPAVKGWVSSHMASSAIVASIISIIWHFLPSPISSSK